MQSPSTPGRQIARAAGTVAAAMILSQVIGLLRGILVYQTFGTTASLDSFNAANRVTEVLFNLIAGGALGSAFIPTFTGLLAHEKRKSAWKLASSVANLLLITLTLISALAAVFAPVIVRHGLFVLAPDLSAGQEALTIQLLRIMLPTVVLFGISGLVMGVLNAYQIFWIPALAPAMYSIGIIIGVLVLPASWGINRLAWGTVIGAGLHMAVQLPRLARLHGSYTRTLGLKMAEVREVARLMGPRIFGVAIVQINFIVNTIIALSLPEGSASAISLAFALMLMPQAAIAQSLAIAAMPTFSAQAALGKLDELRSSLAGALRGALLLALPAAVGLILLREPLIQFLYERGEFTSRSTEMVAWALLWYAAGLPAHSVVEIVSRAFYALHNTRTPVLIGAAAMSLNLAFSFLFSAWFERIGWMPHGGLALANVLATTLEMLILLLLMRRRLNGLETRLIGGSMLRSCLSAGGMAAMLVIWLRYTPALPTWLTALGGIAIGGFVYILLLLLLREPQAGRLASAIRRRIS